MLFPRLFHQVLVATTTLLVLAVTASRAAAQPSAADADARQARILYQKGNAAFKSGDDILARDYYKRSLNLAESFDTLCNLGRAEARGKLWQDSYYHLGLCLELYPEDEELLVARQKFASLREQVALELPAETTQQLDGQVVSYLKQHQQPASPANSAAPVNADVNDEAAEENQAAPNQAAAEQAAAEQAGATPQNADGAQAATSPEDRGRSYRPGRIATTVTLASLGFVSAAASGALFGKYAGQRADAFELRDRMLAQGISCQGANQPASCLQLEDDLNSAKRLRTLGYVTAGAGLALLTTAVVLYVVWPHEPSRPGSSNNQRWTPAVATSALGTWTFGVNTQF